MHRRATPLALALMLVAVACGGSPGPSGQTTASPSQAGSPSATAGPATATPTGGPTSSPTAPPALVHCTSSVPAGDNLIIGTVTGDATVVVRDIQDPARARNLCRFDNNAFSARFVSASAVAYVTAVGQIVKATLATGAIQVLAVPGGGFGPGTYSISADGTAATYLNGDGWHLANASGDRVLTTLPAAASIPTATTRC